MPALSCLYCRSQASVHPALLASWSGSERILTSGRVALGERNDGTATLRGSSAARALAACHRSGLLLAFDGRLDNRTDLARSLPLPRPLTEMADAEVVAAAWERWGEGCLERLLGPFVLALYESTRQQLLLARDPTGGRSLAWAAGQHWFLAATDEAALLGHPEVDAQLDEARLARYFALDVPGDEHTFHRGIRQLLPGEWLRVGTERLERGRFWWPQPGGTLDRRPEERAERLGATLAEAVRCRLTGAGQTAVLMSGGLDSTPIAAHARGALPPGARLDALSWVFPQHRRADERPLIEAVGRHLALTPRWIGGDDAGPLLDLDGWPVHPTTPEQNAYRLLHERAYAAAAELGVATLLSGMCGDQLWTGAEAWLADGLFRGDRRSALADLTWHLRRGELSRAVGASLLPFSWRLERSARRARAVRPWLTEKALALLPDPTASNWAARFPRPRQALSLLDPTNGHGLAVERFWASQHGVEVRYPLRDRRLIELTLALPTGDLYHRGETRPLLRRALMGRLPASVLGRKGKATFEELFVEGVYRGRREAVSALLFRRSALWPEYLQRGPVDSAWRDRATGFSGLLLWLALSLELWLDRRGGGQAGGHAQGLAPSCLGRVAVGS
ncbi:MAG TPA: asparagine synthase-related protein [Thermoanaerobaculia bacterium]|nr:asparagine synthase-related protein [Thermoanaerobaculia bacterium]